VVIDNLDVVRPVIHPTEADTVLLVYSDRVLTGSITAQFFESVSRRDAEVVEQSRVGDPV